MKITKFIEKYWIGLAIGLAVGYFIFLNYHQPLMAAIPLEVPTSVVSTNIFGMIFGFVGSIAGGYIQKSYL